MMVAMQIQFCAHNLKINKLVLKANLSLNTSEVSGIKILRKVS